MITLYDYFRSTAAYRVRIALNIKSLPFEKKEVHLVNNGGEQFSDEYRALNPQSLLPTLVDDNQNSENPIVLNQSLAILEYLEETYPETAILPSDPVDRAWVRSIALSVACDIHPLNNLRVLKYLKNDLSVNEKDKMRWYHHWLEKGFTALEEKLTQLDSAEYCFGDSPMMADICLIPQLYNTKRFKFPLDDYPHIRRIDEACLSLAAFQAASPESESEPKGV